MSTTQTHRRQTVDEVARPSGNALASLEEMFRQAGLAAHDLLARYETTEPDDDDHHP